MGVAMGTTHCSGQIRDDGSAREDSETGDASTRDSVADAPRDAFCDAPWPTTKSGIQRCARVVATTPAVTCSPREGLVKQVCEANRWVCPEGTFDFTKCPCTTPAPGWLCTATGMIQVDGGR